MFPTRFNRMPRGVLAVGPCAFAVALVCAVAIAVSTPAAAAVAGNKDLAMPSAAMSPGLPLSAAGGRSSLGPVVPPPPCHPNSNALLDIISVTQRGDVVHLPDPLRQRLIELAARPHSVLPVQARAEADAPSQLFQYYLLDTHGFEPNVFTALFPGSTTWSC